MAREETQAPSWRVGGSRDTGAAAMASGRTADTIAMASKKRVHRRGKRRAAGGCWGRYRGRQGAQVPSRRTKNSKRLLGPML